MKNNNIEEKKIHKLKIDNEYKLLIPPLTSEEYHQLEDNIKKYGCREPICVWNNTIIDGHNRYEICIKYNIEFYIQEIEFKSKEDVIVWMCAYQLRRRNISEKNRKYLIGKKYESEKSLSMHKNNNGANQYQNVKNDETGAISEKTDISLSNLYKVSPRTIRNYGNFSRIIDKLNEKSPELASFILNENIKITDSELPQIVAQNEQQIKKIAKKVKKARGNYIKFSEIKPTIKPTQKTVKDMPVYNPDADTKSLSCTIPSWIGSLERTFSLTDFKRVSGGAKNQLKLKLEKLKETVDIIILAMEEK